MTCSATKFFAQQIVSDEGLKSEIMVEAEPESWCVWLLDHKPFTCMVQNVFPLIQFILETINLRYLILKLFLILF